MAVPRYPHDPEKIAGAVATLEEAKRRGEIAAKAAGEKALQDIMASVESETGKKPITTASGVMYIVLKEGEGASPKSTDRVKVHYTGWLVDGTKFDSSADRGKPSSFSLNGVIKGWTEGVELMKVGGKWKFIIPPALGYGSRGSERSVPPNATLIFDIELLGIE